MTFADEKGVKKHKTSVNASKHDIELPQTIIDEFARFLVPEIRKFYQSEKGQRELKKWQAEQAQNKGKDK
ncbi:MAG TPA: hypothetical protein DEB31_08755 [Clostridiales bacterium]|nr:hypothetical protein [Clostridiales bacterium]